MVLVASSKRRKAGNGLGLTASGLASGGDAPGLATLACSDESGTGLTGGGLVISIHSLGRN